MMKSSSVCLLFLCKFMIVEGKISVSPPEFVNGQLMKKNGAVEIKWLPDSEFDTYRLTLYWQQSSLEHQLNASRGRTILNNLEAGIWYTAVLRRGVENTTHTFKPALPLHISPEDRTPFVVKYEPQGTYFAILGSGILGVTFGNAIQLFFRNERLVELASGKCLKPDSLVNNAAFRLTDDCNDQMTRFRQTCFGSIQSIVSGKCLHLTGGIKGLNNTPVVLYDHCRLSHTKLILLRDSPDKSICGGGVFVKVANIDGSKETFANGAPVWNSSLPFNEEAEHDGLATAELKTRFYGTLPAKRICLGSLRQDTESMGTLSFHVAAQHRAMSMRELLTKSLAAQCKNREAWKNLMGVNSLQQHCNKGGTLPTNQAMIGFVTNNQQDCDSPNIITGIGVKSGYTSAACGTLYWQTKIPNYCWIFVPKAEDKKCYTMWSAWGPCNGNCGAAVTRSRACTLPYNEGDAIEEDTETDTCSRRCPSGAPQGVMGFETSSTSLTIKWKAPLSDGGTIINYDVLFYENSGQSVLPTKIRQSVSKTLKQFGLKVFHPYSVVVRANKELVKGSFSEPIIVRTGEEAPIGFPGNLRLTNWTSSCFNLTWEEVPDSEAQGLVTKYHIYATESSSGTLVTADILPGTPRVICGLKPFVDYDLQMSISNSKGEGPKGPSVALREKTDEDVPSSPPPFVTARNLSSTSLFIKWDFLPHHLWNGIPRAHNVYVFNVTTGDLVCNLTVYLPAQTATVENLQVYMPYTVQVAAVTVKGEGMRSQPIRAWSDEEVPIAAPTILGTSVTSSTSIELWMSMPAERLFLGEPLGTYIYVHNVTNLSALVYQIRVAPRYPFSVINKLYYFTNYSFQAAFYTRKGVGPLSSPAFNKTLEDKPTGAPINIFFVNHTIYSINISWTTMKDREWNGVPRGYIVRWKKESNQWSFSGKLNLSESYVIHGLEVFTEYEIQVAGRTSPGTGVFSRSHFFKTDETEPSPASNVITTAISAHSIKVQWKPPNQARNTSALKGVWIYYQPIYEPDALNPDRKRARRDVATELNNLQKEERSMFISISHSSAVVSGLTGYINYSVQVAVVAGKMSNRTIPVYVTTLSSKPIVAPEGLEGKATSHTSILVSWRHTPMALLQGVLQGYNVYYRQLTPRGAWKNETQPRKFTFLELTYLKIFTEYEIYVTGYNEVTESSASLKIVVRTKEWYPTASPTNIQVSRFLGPRDLHVNWTKIPSNVSFWKGVPQGYRLRFTPVLVGETSPSEKMAKIFEQSVPFGASEFRWNQADVYTTYKVEIAGFNNVGNGPWSASKLGETCHLGSPTVQVNWKKYSSLAFQLPGQSQVLGTFPFALNYMLGKCAGPCSLFGKGYKLNIVYKAVQNQTEAFTSVNEGTPVIYFPAVPSTFQPENKTFIRVQETTTASLFMKSADEINVATFDVAFQSILAPLALMLFTCFFGGTIFWLIERRHNQLFHPRLLKGMWEGFYFAFITGTTVGYGDFVVTTVRGRLFGMTWMLLMLVMVSIVVGMLSGALEKSAFTAVESISESGNEKVAVMQGSIEHANIEHFIGIKGALNVTFASYDELIEYVGNGQASYMILDNFMAKTYSSLIQRYSLEMEKQLWYKRWKNYGMVTSGDYTKLKSCFQAVVHDDGILLANEFDTLIRTYAQRHLGGEGNLANHKHTLSFFDPDSPWFSNLLNRLTILLGVASLAGCFFEIASRYRAKLKARKVDVSDSPNIRIVQCSLDMEYSILVWKESLTKRLNELTEKHAQDRVELNRAKMAVFGQYRHIDIDAVLKASGLA